MGARTTCETIRETMRPYVLGTLPDRRRRAVEVHLRGCDACREALEAERVRLEVLNALPRDDAPAGLAERTLTRIGAERATAPEKRNWRPIAAIAVVLLMIGAATVPVFIRFREAERRASTQETMKQWGLAFKAFANASPDGRWPALATETRAWAPDMEALYQANVLYPPNLVSGAHPDHDKLVRALEEGWENPRPDFEKAAEVMGESFGYLGFPVEDEGDFAAVRRSREQLETSDAIRIEKGDSVKTIPPLREGVERFLITDINNPAGTSAAQSTIPVLIEIASWKNKRSIEEYSGANVLYMDGHVAFVPYGTFPVVPSVLDELSGNAAP